MVRRLSIILKFLLLIYFQTGNSKIANAQQKPYIDFQIDNPKVYDSLGLKGSYVPVSFILKNTGSDNSYKTVWTYFYISKDSLFSSDDKSAGWSYDNMLEGDSSLYVNRKVGLPNEIRSGKYYVLFVADGNNGYEYTETNRKNNYAYAPINIKAVHSELATKLIGVTTSTIYPREPVVPISKIYPGESVIITCTRENLGSDFITDYYIDLVLSSDSIYDDSLDRKIYTGYTYTLSPNFSDSITIGYTFDDTVSAGEYFLISKIGIFYGGRDEDGKTSFLKIKIIPPNFDLSIKTLSLNPSTVIAGNSTELSGYLYNDGADSSKLSKIVFYLFKTEPSPNSSDGYYLSEIDYKSIKSKSQIPFDKKVFIPHWWCPGEYYIGCSVWSYGIVDTDMNNNIAFKKITIKADSIDLSVKSTSVEANVTVTQPIYVQAIVNNAGIKDARFFVLGYFLSNDEYYSSDDIYLGGSQVNNLGYQTSIPVTGQITIPYDVKSGAYKLLFVADNFKYVYENNEENNVFVTSIEVENPKYPKDIIINPDNANDSLDIQILSKAKLAVGVVPNPASDIINVIVQTIENPATISYELYDSFGLVSREGVIKSVDHQFTIPAHDLSPGIYLLKVAYEGDVETIRVYKE